LAHKIREIDRREGDIELLEELAAESGVQDTLFEKKGDDNCIMCGLCVRVCPMDISLSAINQKMAGLVEEWFDFRSGLTPDQQAPFTTWSADDPEIDIL